MENVMFIMLCVAAFITAMLFLVWLSLLVICGIAGTIADIMDGDYYD